MSHILVSYRREDSVAYAGRLADRLRQHFGPDHVFIDMDAIRFGDDFVHAIETSVKSCDVVVAVIGPDWLSATDSNGRRRLENSDDFVRLEIATALQRGIRVVPALVGGAAMPQAHELPEGLSTLARRQALELSDDAFHQDVDRLIEALSGDNRLASRFATPRRVALLSVVTILAALLLISAIPSVRKLLEGGQAQQPAPLVVSPGPASQPQPVAVGTTYQTVLGANEEAYFMVSTETRQFGVVLDARCSTRLPCTLGAALSILDGQGAVVQGDAIWVSTYDVGYRTIRTVELSKPDNPQLKLVNHSGMNVDYWLTVVDPPEPAGVRLFGEHSPTPIELGRETTGTLERGQAATYVLLPKRGEYAVTLDLSVAPNPPTPLAGYVAVVDSAGGDEVLPVWITEYGVSARKTGSLAIQHEGAHLFRVQNTRDGAVNYRFRMSRR
jgi:hypothetical protein